MVHAPGVSPRNDFFDLERPRLRSTFKDDIGDPVFGRYVCIVWHKQGIGRFHLEPDFLIGDFLALDHVPARDADLVINIGRDSLTYGVLRSARLLNRTGVDKLPGKSSTTAHFFLVELTVIPAASISLILLIAPGARPVLAKSPSLAALSSSTVK